MPEISLRGTQMPESPIRKLAPLAYAAKQRGVHVYHLNIGQPDLPTPRAAIDAIRNIDRKILEYSPSQGGAASIGRGACCVRKASPKKGGSLKGVLNLLCPKTHAGEPLWGRGGHLRQQILGQRLVSCAFVVPLQFHAALGGYLSWGQQASVTDRVTHYI